MIDLDIGELVTFFYTTLLQRHVIVHRADLLLRLFYVDEYMSFAAVAAIETLRAAWSAGAKSANAFSSNTAQGPTPASLQ